MGLKGAAGALMLREAAVRLRRPILAIASTPGEAETLAHEAAFFLDESLEADTTSRTVHVMPAWELKPFAHLSPPHDTQAAQLAALYTLIRADAPLVVASVEALMMRTVPRRALADSILRVAPAERIDLDAMVEELAALGYQRVPQAEEIGDFSVRGGIVDVFSPLYRDPIRFELEDDIIVSLRRFEAPSQRSLNEMAEAIIVRTRLIP